MGPKNRFEFMFNPRFWPLPFLICWQRSYYGAHRNTEISFWIGPFGLSAVIGRMDEICEDTDDE